MEFDSEKEVLNTFLELHSLLYCKIAKRKGYIVSILEQSLRTTWCELLHKFSFKVSH